MLRSTTCIALFAGGLLMQSAAAYGRNDVHDLTASGGPTQSSASEAQDPLTAEQIRKRLTSDGAAREIQKRHGGRVLSVHADGAGYRVKMLKNGEVRIYQINP
jgi:hypothetical protein